MWGQGVRQRRRATRATAARTAPPRRRRCLGVLRWSGRRTPGRRSACSAAPSSPGGYARLHPGGSIGEQGRLKGRHSQHRRSHRDTRPCLAALTVPVLGLARFSRQVVDAKHVRLRLREWWVAAGHSTSTASHCTFWGHNCMHAGRVAARPQACHHRDESVPMQPPS